MWPESSPVNAVNLVEKSAIIPEISNFSCGKIIFWRTLYTPRAGTKSMYLLVTDSTKIRSLR